MTTTYETFDDLPAAGALSSGDRVPIRQGTSGAVTAKTTIGAIAAFSGGGLTNPMTTAQDIIVGGTAGVPTRLGVGANGTVLGVTGGVLGYVAGGSGSAVQPLIGINPQTGNYTLTLGDFPTDGSITDVQITDSSASTLTIPPHSSVAAPVGSQGMTSQWGAGVVTITAGSGVTLVDAFGVATTAQYDSRYFRQ